MDDGLATALDRENLRARWTIYLLFAGLGADVVAIASNLSRWVTLRQVAHQDIGPERVAEFALQHGAIAALKVLTLIPTMVLWLVWLHRAYANLRLVGSRQSKFTAGASIGFWFIPFANLFLPYQITADLWLRSDARNVEASLAGRGAPALLGWWWVGYIIARLLDRSYFSLAENLNSVEQQLAAATAGILASTVGIVAALLAIAVVRGIDMRQQSFVTS